MCLHLNPVLVRTLMQLSSLLENQHQYQHPELASTNNNNNQHSINYPASEPLLLIHPSQSPNLAYLYLVSLDGPCNCLPARGMQAAMEEEYRREFQDELRGLRGRLRDDIDNDSDPDADFKSDDHDSVDEDM